MAQVILMAVVAAALQGDPGRLEESDAPPTPAGKPPTAYEGRVGEGPRQIQIGAPAYVVVHNQMGQRFRLVEAVVLLDAAEVAHVKAVKGGELERDFRVFEGAVPPGEHAVTVTLVFQGRNPAFFSYVDDYRFRAATTGAFTVDVGDHRPATIEVVAHERKGANVAFEQKPQLELTPAAGSSAVPMIQSQGGRASP